MKSESTIDGEEVKISSADSCNDNSNPQQGNGGSNKMTKQANQDNRGNTKNEKNNSKPISKGKGIRKLFVGGLPPDITETEFRVFFEQYGSVVDSVVMFDKETRRSRGFGFVTFQDPDVAAGLLVSGRKTNKKKTVDEPCIGRLVMRGKTCEIKAAEPKGARQSRRQYVRENAPNNARYYDLHGQRRYKMHGSSSYPNGASTINSIPAMGGCSQFPFVSQELPWNAPMMTQPLYVPSYGFNAGATHRMMQPSIVPHDEMLAARQMSDATPLLGTHMDGPNVYNMNAPTMEINNPPHPSNFYIMPMPYLYAPHLQPHHLSQQYVHTNNPMPNQSPMVLTQHDPNVISRNEEKRSTNEVT